VVGPEAGDEDIGPVTIYDSQAAEDSKVRVRALPRLTRQALRIARAAGRREFVVSTLLQIIGGGGIVLLLLGQKGLQALLEALQSGQSLAAVAPWALVIACVAGIQSFVNAVSPNSWQGSIGPRQAQLPGMALTSMVLMPRNCAPALQ
jgi:CBS domain containing-hemolysin-like protein